MKCHLGIKDYRCEDCGNQFTLQRSLNQHVEIVHLKYESNMKTHLKSHSKGKGKCVECGKQCESDRALKEHVARMHEGKGKM